MGHVLKIPRIIKREAKTVVILNPLEDLREIMDEHVGMENRDLFDEVIRDQVWGGAWSYVIDQMKEGENDEKSDCSKD